MNRPLQKNAHCSLCGCYRWSNFIAGIPYCRDCLVVYINKLRGILRKYYRITNGDGQILTPEEEQILEEITNPFAES